MFEGGGDGVERHENKIRCDPSVVRMGKSILTNPRLSTILIL